MQEQIEQPSLYEQIKAEYSEALIILKQLKGDEDEARRSQKLLEKEM